MHFGCHREVRQPDPTAPAELGPEVPEPGSAAEGAALDPELLALAAPPRTQRLAALTVMAAAVVAMLALILSLRGEMAYALQSNRPVDLGPARKLAPSRVTPNQYVRLSGVPGIARAVRFRRGLGATYQIFPLVEQHGVFVQAPDTGGESFVQAEYTGRLTTFGSLGRRYAQLAETMREEAGLTVNDESLVLLLGEQPGDYTWTWLVLVLCLGFAALDVFLIVRWFRPLRWAELAG